MSTSLLLAGIVTALALLVGYPLAYALHTRVRSARARAVLAVVLFCPLMISVVVRTYGWLILLANQGLVNTTLLRLGLIEQPVRLLFNMQGVVISLTHIMLPFAIFPIYSVLGKLDASLKEAARDLGAGPWATFWRVTLPLTLPGVASGGVICFTLALSAFVTPQLLGGGRVQVLPLTVYNSTVEINWPEGAVTSVALLALSILVGLGGQPGAAAPADGGVKAVSTSRGRDAVLRTVLGLGVGFILLPLGIVVLYSFSSVAYGSSRRPACRSAGTPTSSISRPSGAPSCGASASAWRPPGWRWPLGVPAALVLVRGRFPGRDALQAFLLSPIVMPKIVLGVGWFIFFARLGIQGGVLPLILAHTIVVLPFVINIVAANLVGLDPALEEAAQDLGASRWTVVWRIVLPQIRPGLVVSALLAFLVSFDQVESSIFLTRGENNTLPIEMFLYMEKWQDPTIAALSALLILFAFTLVVGRARGRPRRGPPTHPAPLTPDGRRLTSTDAN